MGKRWALAVLALLACGDESFEGSAVDDGGANDGSSDGGAIIDGGVADAPTDTGSSCGSIPCGTTLLADTQMYEPTELAVNGARVFWTEANGTTSLVESCPITGCSSAADFIQHQTALDTFGGLGADDDGVAFTLNTGNRVVACLNATPGCMPDRLTASTHVSPLGVAFADALHVVEGSSTGINDHFDGGSTGYIEGPTSLVAVADTDLFYILEPNPGHFVVRHAPLAGGVFSAAPTDWAEAGGIAPLGLAAHSGLAVWVAGLKIVQFAGAPAAVTNAELAPDAALQRVATDGSKIYATDDTGRVLRCDLPTCSNMTALVTGATHPRGIAVDANYVYFADRGGATGRILRAPK